MIDRIKLTDSVKKCLGSSKFFNDLFIVFISFFIFKASNSLYGQANIIAPQTLNDPAIPPSHTIETIATCVKPYLFHLNLAHDNSTWGLFTFIDNKGETKYAVENVSWGIIKGEKYAMTYDTITFEHYYHATKPVFTAEDTAIKTVGVIQVFGEGILVQFSYLDTVFHNKKPKYQAIYNLNFQGLEKGKYYEVEYSNKDKGRAIIYLNKPLPKEYALKKYNYYMGQFLFSPNQETKKISGKVYRVRKNSIKYKYTVITSSNKKKIIKKKLNLLENASVNKIKKGLYSVEYLATDCNKAVIHFE